MAYGRAVPALAGLALLGFAWPAGANAAELPPRLSVRQDTTVVYKVTQTAPPEVAGDLGNMTSESKVYLSARGRQRHETRVTGMGGGAVGEMLAAQPPQISLVEADGAKVRTRMLDPVSRSVITREEDTADLAFSDMAFHAPLPGSPPARLGKDTVAGVPCTTWRLQDDADGKAEACYTAEGLALRFRHARSDGVVSTREALSVAVAPIDPALFEVPKGWSAR